jgi:hypothetical protein
MIAIAGGSLHAPAYIGRTLGLCRALGVELLLGLPGFVIGGIEKFRAGKNGLSKIGRVGEHGAGLGEAILIRGPGTLLKNQSEIYPGDHRE